MNVAQSAMGCVVRSCVRVRRCASTRFLPAGGAGVWREGPRLLRCGRAGRPCDAQWARHEREPRISSLSEENTVTSVAISGSGGQTLELWQGGGRNVSFDKNCWRKGLLCSGSSERCECEREN